MSEWKKYKLGDIMEVKHGFAFKGEFFVDEPTDDILLTPGNFKIGGGFKSDKFKYYAGEYPKEYILKEGDILITMTDLSKEGDTLGYSAKIPRPHNIRYLHNQRLGKVKFKSFDFNENFLYWILRTSKYHNFIVSSATGSTVKHTSPTRISNYEFYAPKDITEQSLIASILSSLDDKIELNLQMNKTLEAIAQAIFKEWFVDFRFPGFDGKLVDGLPKGWKKGRLGEIASLQNGYAFKSKDFKSMGENGIIKIKNISGNVVDIINVQFIEKEIADRVDSRFRVRSQDLLIAMTGAEVGKVGIVPHNDKDLWINQRVGLFKEKVKCAKWFCYLILASNEYQDKLLNTASGSAQPNISSNQIEGIEIILPTADNIELFGKVINSLFDRITNNYLQNQLLMEIRDILLPKLMSGKIRVA